jgi:hypothetical protein
MINIMLAGLCNKHRAKTPILGKGPQPFSWGKKCVFLAYFGKGVSNLTQTFNKFFKIDKQKAMGNTKP